LYIVVVYIVAGELK